MNYFPNDGDGLHLCEVCGDYECQWPATKCWRCREQEAIDREDWLDEQHDQLLSDEETSEDEP